MRKNVIPLLKYQRSLETVDWPHTQDLRFILPFFVIFGSSPSHHFFFSVSRNATLEQYGLNLSQMKINSRASE